MAKARRTRKVKAAALTRPVVVVEPLITPETAAHGDYVDVEFVEKVGQRPVKVVRNRGGTAVERWHVRGDLTRGQAEAIALYARAWRVRYEFNERVTMNWGLSTAGGGDHDALMVSQQSAKNLLEHLDAAVFFAFPLHYFEVWRQVVIEDEPTGTAGGRLGFTSKQAESAAKAIVVFIADMIATDMRLGDAR